MKTQISKSTSNFFNYSFKGDGKYYLHEQGSRHYRMTSFNHFLTSNADCVQIIERGNDAPRGGYCGNYVNVEFNERFYEKYGWFFEEKKILEQKAKEEEERKKLLEEEITQKFRIFVENNPLKVEEWKKDLLGLSHKKGRLYKENRVARAVGNFDFWGKYRIFDEIIFS
jgi:hypothetical protein